MQDIPIFTTENGVASLILREIPYNGSAYVRIQATASPEALLEDCTGFCKAAGAETMYATGHESLERFPMHAAIRRLKWEKKPLKTDAIPIPATEENLEAWREVYNRKMAGVPTAAYMTQAAAKKLLEEHKALFVYQGGACIGIGAAKKDTVEAVAAVVPGAGWNVLAALCNILTESTVYLDVAESNEKAFRLYERFGFEKTEKIVYWHQIY